MGEHPDIMRRVLQETTRRSPQYIWEESKSVFLTVSKTPAQEPQHNETPAVTEKIDIGESANPVSKPASVASASKVEVCENVTNW